MGYEVLGSGRDDDGGPGVPRPPVTGVVDLGEPDPTQTSPGHGPASADDGCADDGSADDGSADDGSADHGGEPADSALRGWARSPRSRLVLTAVAAAALGGVLAGGWAEVDRRRDAERVLYAAAQVSGLSTDPVPGGSRTVVTTLVSNYGPEPVTVVSGPSAGGRVVRMLSGTSPVVAPGGQVALDLQVTFSCRSDVPRPVDAVPVRTADGRRHDVRLTSPYGPVALRDSACARPGSLEPAPST
jgi:hypothetical protein